MHWIVSMRDKSWPNTSEQLECHAEGVLGEGRAEVSELALGLYL